MLHISTLGDVADVNPVIKFLPHTLHVCGRNLITGMTSAASPRMDVSSTCKIGQKLGVSLSLSIDMLPFGVTIPATVPQRSEIPERLMNYPLFSPYRKVSPRTVWLFHTHSKPFYFSCIPTLYSNCLCISTDGNNDHTAYLTMKFVKGSKCFLGSL